MTKQSAGLKWGGLCLQRVHSYFLPWKQISFPSLQVTFSMADSLFRSGTNYGNHDPAHLRLHNLI